MRRSLSRIASDTCTALRHLHASASLAARRKHDADTSNAFAYFFTSEVDLFWHDVSANTPTAHVVHQGPQPGRRLPASLQAAIDVHNERLREDWAAYSESSDEALHALQVCPRPAPSTLHATA